MKLDLLKDFAIFAKREGMDIELDAVHFAHPQTHAAWKGYKGRADEDGFPNPLPNHPSTFEIKLPKSMSDMFRPGGVTPVREKFIDRETDSIYKILLGERSEAPPFWTQAMSQRTMADPRYDALARVGLQDKFMNLKRYPGVMEPWEPGVYLVYVGATDETPAWEFANWDKHGWRHPYPSPAGAATSPFYMPSHYVRAWCGLNYDPSK